MLEDQLLFRSITGRTSEEEEQSVAAWRAAAPAHERRYQELAAILAAAERGRRWPVSEPPPSGRIVEIAARRAWARRAPGRRWHRPVLAAAGLAAAALLAAGGIWMVRRPAAGTLAITELATGASETTTVSLSDGTVVRLAPKSVLRFPAAGPTREVTLEGRGFFAVAKQHGRPFRVRTSAGDLTVLGTRFDVESRERDLRMVVVEGRVAVAAAEGGETKVTAGQVSRVVAGRLQPTARIPDLGSETKWVGRFLAFQSTPLRDAAREIERIYSVRVVVDSAIADRTVSTWLADRSLEEVVRIVCAVSVARCAVEKGVVTIAGS